MEGEEVRSDEEGGGWWEEEEEEEALALAKQPGFTRALVVCTLQLLGPATQRKIVDCAVSPAGTTATGRLRQRSD